jgi:ADYC domain
LQALDTEDDLFPCRGGRRAHTAAGHSPEAGSSARAALASEASGQRGHSISARAGHSPEESGSSAREPTVTAIEAYGTSFRATLSDSSVKQGVDLTGAVLVIAVNGSRLRVRIASVTPDPLDKTGTVLLHDFRLEDSGEPLCTAGPDGTRLGFPLAGRSLPDGRFVAAEPGIFELTCTAGARGKCVRFGYHPWERVPDGRTMRDHYNACVRLVRADYCGDNRGWTRNGTAIDLWDDLGIQESDSGPDQAFSFEAGWNANGAVCVAHTRIPENITLDRLKAACPRLAAAPACDETSARAAGAMLFNRSR